MRPGSMIRAMLLLPCIVAFLPARRTEGDLELDHAKPVNQLRVLGEADGGADGVVQKHGRDAERVQDRPSPSLEGSRGGHSAGTVTSVPEHSHLLPGKDRAAILKEIGVALHDVWARGAELAPEDRVRFGLCPSADEQTNKHTSSLLLLAKKLSTEQERSRLHILHPAKELWEMKTGEAHRSRLILHFHLPPFLQSHLHRVTPMLLFRLWGSVDETALSISFTGRSLQPHQQTVCLLMGTQFIFLTGRETESDAQSHLLWQVTMETHPADTGDARPAGSRLAEVSWILLGKAAEYNVTESPLLFLLMDRRKSEMPGSAETLEVGAPPKPAPPSATETFIFLCELQTFLREALSQTQLTPGPPRVAAVSLDTLLSLPSVTLGSSSSEHVLLGLLNSSAPTLFSFPHQTSELRAHRVELTLKPHLLSVLQARLEEAVAQMVTHDVGGYNVTERLRRLQELSELPAEEDEPTGGMGNSRERQYRAVLLLKALQTILGVWEGARGERMVRGDEEDHGRGAKCRLYPLTVPVVAPLLSPPALTINNCHGSCSTPVFKGTNHAMLLNSYGNSQPLERAPCCVPEKYEDLQVAELDSNGTLIHFKPNMVAKECGCR